MEQWKEIPGYEGIYEVSNYGQVKRIKDEHNTYAGKILAGGFDEDGYHLVLLYKGGKRRMFKVHRLVAQAFIPNPDNLPQVNHKNTRKWDNAADNLEWSTAKHNINHAIDNGLWNPSRGADRHNAKLDDNRVLQIRDLLFLGKRPEDIGPAYGVHPTTIADIQHRRTWAWLQ